MKSETKTCIIKLYASEDVLDIKQVHASALVFVHSAFRQSDLFEYCLSDWYAGSGIYVVKLFNFAHKLYYVFIIIQLHKRETTCL